MIQRQLHVILLILMMGVTSCKRRQQPVSQALELTHPENVEAVINDLLYDALDI